MPREVDASHFVYRKVDPDEWDDQGVLVDAFQDTHANLSFWLAGVCAPCDVLQVFSRFRWVKELCKTTEKPDCMEMYRAGFRVAVVSVQLILDSGFMFNKDANGDEYSSEGHTDVVNGQAGAVIWSANARCSSETEMQTGFKDKERS